MVKVGLVSVLLFASVFAFAAEEAPLSEDQLLTPNVKRERVKVGKIDTEDFEVGAYAGLYAIEDFGTNLVVGARFAFHFSEDFFLEGTYGLTKADRTTIEKIFEIDFLTEEERELTYYNVLFGWNMFPGEAFIGDSWAFVTRFYLVGGAGNTNFGGEDRFTITWGLGYQFFATDWMSIHVDFRDHIFDQDILGEEKTTQNLELTSGFSIYF